jgi:branched-chain amino acid transport system permease protein
MTTFLQQLANGISVSCVYILAGVGITLIFGLTRIANFAQGQFLIAGGFIAATLVDHGVGFWFALVLAGAAVALMGVLSERTVFARSYAQPMQAFIVSLGLMIGLQAIMVMLWGSDVHSVTSPVVGVWDVGGVRIPKTYALVTGITATAMALLWLLLRRTAAGRSLRAVAENRDAAGLIGVHVQWAMSVSFALGAFLAGLAGALLGSFYPFTALSGVPLVIKGLAVALIGGLGSVPGAVVAGLTLGLLETLASGYGVPGPEWRDGYAFVLMVAILAWRPQGLFRGTGMM